MEVLTVGSAIVGLIAVTGSVSKKLSNLISESTRAPRNVRDLKSDTDGICNYLKLLRRCLDQRQQVGQSREARITVNQLLGLLSDCVKTAAELEALVDSFPRNLSLRQKWRWATRKSEIGRIQKRVRIRKTALNDVVNVLQCVYLDDVKRALERLEFNTTKILEEKENENIRNRLSRSTENERDQNAAAFQRMGGDGWQFGQELERSRVYGRLVAREVSIAISGTKAVSWSFFTDKAMSEVSNISVISLPLGPREIPPSFYVTRYSGPWRLAVAVVKDDSSIFLSLLRQEDGYEENFSFPACFEFHLLTEFHNSLLPFKISRKVSSASELTELRHIAMGLADFLCQTDSFIVPDAHCRHFFKAVQRPLPNWHQRPTAERRSFLDLSLAVETLPEQNESLLKNFVSVLGRVRQDTEAHLRMLRALSPVLGYVLFGNHSSTSSREWAFLVLMDVYTVQIPQRVKEQETLYATRIPRFQEDLFGGERTMAARTPVEQQRETVTSSMALTGTIDARTKIRYFPEHRYTLQCFYKNTLRLAVTTILEVEFGATAPETILRQTEEVNFRAAFYTQPVEYALRPDVTIWGKVIFFSSIKSAMDLEPPSCKLLVIGEQGGKITLRNPEYAVRHKFSGQATVCMVGKKILMHLDQEHHVKSIFSSQEIALAPAFPLVPYSQKFLVQKWEDAIAKDTAGGGTCTAEVDAEEFKRTIQATIMLRKATKSQSSR